MLPDMKLIISLKDADLDVIGLKEEIASRLEGILEIIRIDVESEEDNDT